MTKAQKIIRIACIVFIAVLAFAILNFAFGTYAIFTDELGELERHHPYVDVVFPLSLALNCFLPAYFVARQKATAKNFAVVTTLTGIGIVILVLVVWDLVAA